MITFKEFKESLNEKNHWLDPFKRYYSHLNREVAPDNYQEKPNTLFTGIDIADQRRAVLNDPEMLQYADVELQNNKETVLRAVKQDGMALKWASVQLQSDPEVVKAAIKQNPGAFLHAAQSLKSDPKIAGLAVNHKQNKVHLAEATERMQARFDELFAAKRQNSIRLSTIVEWFVLELHDYIKALTRVSFDYQSQTELMQSKAFLLNVQKSIPKLERLEPDTWVNMDRAIASLTTAIRMHFDPLHESKRNKTLPGFDEFRKPNK
jgi:hypothetical protein